MKRFLLFAAFGLTLVTAPLPAQQNEAQQEETATAEEAGGSGGFLVNLLENTLSNENQQVQVTGLEGALSSRATIERIEISDPEGVWLTISGAVLDWNRLALVRGRFSVNELTADQIDVARPPQPTEQAELPAPEAKPFALPDLPVAVQISSLSIGRISLGAPLLGQAAELGLTGRLALADGGLDTDLQLDRLDRTSDRIGVRASFDPEAQIIGIDVTATEEAGGLISGLLKLPGTPPLALTVAGTGPVSDFNATLALSTDGQERVTGQVNLAEQTAEDGAVRGIGFDATLAGDVTPLMAETFHEFFGTDTRLSVMGQRNGAGQIRIEDLQLQANALAVNGNFDLSAEARRATADLTARITAPDGDDVVLPTGNPGIAVSAADLRFRLDSDAATGWQLEATVDRVQHPEIGLDRVQLSGSGPVDLQGDQLQLSGEITGGLDGLRSRDPGLQEAIGDQIALSGSFALPGDGTLNLSDISVSGEGYGAMLGASIQGLEAGFFFSGTGSVQAADISQFSRLVGRPLSGGVTAGISGSGQPLGGAFDIVLTGEGQDLSAGIAELDPLLAGETRLSLEAGRDENGITLRNLTLNNPALTAEASGQARTGQADLTLNAGLSDLGLILPEVPGRVDLAGSVSLAGQDLDADLTLEAPDNARAKLSAVIRDRGRESLELDLDVREDAGGPLSTLLNLPGQPALAFTTSGSGSLSNFDADVLLQTDTIQRLGGTVSLAQSPEEDSLAVSADLDGDLSELIPLAYRDFFGTRTELALAASRAATGRIEVETLSLLSNALKLDGTLAIASDGLPETVQLQASIRPPQGGNVLLPIPGPPIRIDNADATLSLDALESGDWMLDLSLSGLDHPQAQLSQLEAQGTGTFLTDPQLQGGGNLIATLDGLALADPGLQELIGSTALLDTRFDLPGDDSLQLRNLALAAGGLDLRATGAVAGLTGDPVASATASFRLDDLARLATLTGQELAGQLTAELSAGAEVASQRFDIDLSALLSGLRTNIEIADELISGDTQLKLSANGTPAAIRIEAFDLQSRALMARAEGLVGTEDTNLQLEARLDDMARVLPASSGAMQLNGTLIQQQADWKADLRLDAPEGSYVEVDGLVSPSGNADVTIDAQMNRVERYLPQFPGTLRANGGIRRANGQWQGDLLAEGPAAIAADITGQFDEASGEANAEASGQLEMAVANLFIAPIAVEGPLRFDLSLAGAATLEALSGRISLSDVNVAIPQIQNTLNNLRGEVTLANGQGQINLQGDVRTGGQLSVSGPVALTGPFDGDIAIALQEIGLTDQISYESSLSGDLAYRGPLIGDGNLSGTITIGETEINLSRASGGVASAPIPPISHLAEPERVFVTRERAGLVGKDGAGGPDIGLDLSILAPGAIYVRGFGLDAELGGQIRVRGSTRRIVPSGQVDLIRGNLNVLGRNLALAKGLVTLQGSLEPYLEFAATSNTEEGSATMQIEGELSAIEITFSSDPERPPEEAAALLLFGNEFASMSPFKLAQVALYLQQLRNGEDVIGASARGAGADSARVGEDSSGAAALGIGGYVSENIYTDLSVNVDGESEINLNLDVTDSLTVRGRVNNEGETGLGLFFERDY